MAGFSNGTLYCDDGVLTQSGAGTWFTFNDGTDTFLCANSHGSPEGVVTADKGSFCTDTTNGNFYIKQTDGVSTGWALLAFASTAITGTITQYAVIVGVAPTVLGSVGPSATAGQVLQSGGSSANPSYSTATYPSTTTINELLYSSATNVIGQVTSVIDGVLISDHAAGVPSWLPNSSTPGYVLTANSGAPPSWQANIDLHTSKFIVSAGGSADGANYTTIASAYAASSSGDTIFIMPGTYTENLTISSSGRIFTAFSGSALSVDGGSGNVIISGQWNFTASTGTTILSGLYLQTNGAPAISFSGTSASAVYLKDCFITSTDQTIISYTTSGSSRIEFFDCNGWMSGTASLITTSGSGACSFNFANCVINTSTSGTSSVANTGGGFNIVGGSFQQTISFGSNVVATIYNCEYIGAITTASTATITIANSSISAGSASALSIGAGTVATISSCTIISSNTNAITGSGTINYGGIVFAGTSSTINTTTKVPIPWPTLQGGTGLSSPGTSGNVLTSNGTIWTSAAPAAPTFTAGSWTPALAFGGATTGITYPGGGQVGNYTQIGSVVFFFGTISLSSKGSATGSATITGLPVSAAATYSMFNISYYGGITLTALYQNIVGYVNGSTTITLNQTGSAQANTALTNTQFSNSSSMYFNGFYFV